MSIYQPNERTSEGEVEEDAQGQRQHPKRDLKSKNEKEVIDALSINQGPWNSNEHNLFIEALLLYGKDFIKIQKHVKTRNQGSLRSHFQNYLI